MPIPGWVTNLRKYIGHEPIQVVGACAVVFNESGDVLLQKRADDGRWGLPGGVRDLDESLLLTVVRETKEETGVDVEVIRLLGVYSNMPIFTYPNGDRSSAVVVAFHCKYLGGEIGNLDGEATEVKFFSPSALPELSPRHASAIVAARSIDWPVAV